MYHSNLSLLSLLKKERKPLIKFPLVLSSFKLQNLKEKYNYIQIPLNPKIIHDYNHVLIYYPFSMESLNYQSRYSTTRNMNLINLMIPVKWYKFINQTYLFYKSNWSYEFQPKVPATLELENFLDLPTYFYYYARIRKRFLKVLPRTYLNFDKYKNLIYIYEKSNFFFNTNYLWHLIFQDPLTQKLINLITKKGKKEKAELIIYKVLFLMNMKFGHIEHPIFILREAFENIKPLIKLDNLSYTRNAQNVPNVISLRNQLKLAFKWILHDVFNNKEIKPFYYKLYLSIINAYFEKGYAFEQMLQVQKLAYDQRAFMYKNYYLRKKQKNPIQFYVPSDYADEEKELDLELENQKNIELNNDHKAKNETIITMPPQQSKTRYLDVILHSKIENSQNKKSFYPNKYPILNKKKQNEKLIFVDIKSSSPQKKESRGYKTNQNKYPITDKNKNLIFSTPKQKRSVHIK